MEKLLANFFYYSRPFSLLNFLRVNIEYSLQDGLKKTLRKYENPKNFEAIFSFPFLCKIFQSLRLTVWTIFWLYLQFGGKIWNSVKIVHLTKFLILFSYQFLAGNFWNIEFIFEMLWFDKFCAFIIHCIFKRHEFWFLWENWKLYGIRNVTLWRVFVFISIQFLAKWILKRGLFPYILEIAYFMHNFAL